MWYVWAALLPGRLTKQTTYEAWNTRLTLKQGGWGFMHREQTRTPRHAQISCWLLGNMADPSHVIAAASVKRCNSKQIVLPAMKSQREQSQKVRPPFACQQFATSARFEQATASLCCSQCRTPDGSEQAGRHWNKSPRQLKSKCFIFGIFWETVAPTHANNLLYILKQVSARKGYGYWNWLQQQISFFSPLHWSPELGGRARERWKRERFLFWLITSFTKELWQIMRCAQSAWSACAGDVC